ncbi:MAG: CAP domain-containing protein [Spirochaetales bacterium]|nr:CAP domain-containing protein [Spirochaetales bacterium]
MPYIVRLRSLTLGIVVVFVSCLTPGRPAAEPAPAWSADDYASVTTTTFRRDPRFLTAIDFKAIDYPLLDAAVFYATNEIRLSRGLKPLAYSAALEEAASGHARRMAEKNFFSHTDPLDKKRATSTDRLRLAGVADPHPAENIAKEFGLRYVGGKSVYKRGPGKFSYSPSGPLIRPHTYLSFADAVLKSWMNSSGHRANILSPNGLELGCGARYYESGSFNNMPMFMAVQNFQWFEKIRMKGGK